MVKVIRTEDFAYRTELTWAMGSDVGKGPWVTGGDRCGVRMICT